MVIAVLSNGEMGLGLFSDFVQFLEVMLASYIQIFA